MDSIVGSIRHGQSQKLTPEEFGGRSRRRKEADGTCVRVLRLLTSAATTVSSSTWCEKWRLTLHPVEADWQGETESALQELWCALRRLRDLFSLGRSARIKVFHARSPSSRDEREDPRKANHDRARRLRRSRHHFLFHSVFLGTPIRGQADVPVARAVVRVLSAPGCGSAGRAAGNGPTSRPMPRPTSGTGASSMAASTGLDDRGNSSAQSVVQHRLRPPFPRRQGACRNRPDGKGGHSRLGAGRERSGFRSLTSCPSGAHSHSSRVH